MKGDKIPCVACGAIMGEGEACPACDHVDSLECVCDYCCKIELQEKEEKNNGCNYMP